MRDVGFMTQCWILLFTFFVTWTAVTYKTVCHYEDCEQTDPYTGQIINKCATDLVNRCSQEPQENSMWKQFDTEAEAESFVKNAPENEVKDMKIKKVKYIVN